MSISGVEVEGLDELIAKLDPSTAAGPARKFFNRGTLLIQRTARDRVHIDRGRLTKSIATEIDTALLPLWGKVGTNLDYAPPVEFGAGPHMPPVAPLEAWATRHGMPGQGYAIALGILKHGTEGQRFLRGGLEDAEPGINRIVPIFAKELEAAMTAGG